MALAGELSRLGLFSACVIAAAGLYVFSVADAAAQQVEQRPPSERETVLKVGPGEIRQVVRTEGAAIRLIDGPQAGYSLTTFPGIQRVTTEELAYMREIPTTGLFIVDASYVPFELMTDLRRQGYQLRDDGTLLDEEGETITMFVRPEVFEVVPRSVGPSIREMQTPRPPSQEDQPEGTNEYHRPPTPRNSTGDLLRDLTGRVFASIAPPAHAAQPFPFTCFGWYWKWQYRGGFCRDYRAWTDAYAYGPASGGGCAGPKPHTKIQYISAYARAANRTNLEHCYDCDQEHAYARRNFGCFWPAHGKGSGFHSVYLVDGTIQVYRSYSWSH